jgi:hypothetical protein
MPSVFTCMARVICWPHGNLNVQNKCTKSVELQYSPGIRTRLVSDSQMRTVIQNTENFCLILNDTA